MAVVVPVVSTGASGIALLRTPSRLAGVLLLLTSAGVVAAGIVWAADQSTPARFLLTGSLLLSGSFAILAYPRASSVTRWSSACG